jgi:hypothetical protein
MPRPAINTENPMESPELIERLRVQGGFRLLPLLSNTGLFAGAHLTRFVVGGHLDVVQVWDERWAVFARLPDEPNFAAPLVGPELHAVATGSLAEVTSPVLQVGARPRHELADDVSARGSLTD